MLKSDSINELAIALVNFQEEMPTVIFDQTNPNFNSKYATLAALVKESRPLLVKHGLAVSQLLEIGGAVCTVLLHKSGQYISGMVMLSGDKKDIHGQASAITYARRYAYAAILGLVSDHDDDGNATIERK